MTRTSYSVSQINNYIKAIIDEDFALSYISIKGEISNFKNHSSGHLYFTLKDSESSMLCVVFKEYAEKLNFLPDNGMEVVVSGNISVYTKTGQYQLYGKKITSAGVGELYKAFEKLKDSLQLKGLFDDKHKKKIPFFPNTVAVITSEEGAALQDIVNIAARRNNIIKIVVVPSLVQGKDAPSEIAKNIDLVNEWGKADCIILARGGGSIEDLWAFNDETVAYAIFNSKIPVVSAIGHETDFTIADLVSDLRAPTPSAAAEIVFTDLIELREQLNVIFSRINFSFENIFTNKENEVRQLANLNTFTNPLDYFIKHEKNIETINSNLDDFVNAFFSQKENETVRLFDKLNAYSPLNVLKRGYSFVLKGDNVVNSVTGLKNNDELKIIMRDGEVSANVTKISLVREGDINEPKEN